MYWRFPKMCSPGTSRSKGHCYGSILVQAVSRRHGALADLGLRLKALSAHIVHSKEHSNTQLSSSLVLFLPPLSGVLSVSDLCYTSRSPAPGCSEALISEWTNRETDAEHQEHCYIVKGSQLGPPTEDKGTYLWVYHPSLGVLVNWFRWQIS